MHPDLTKMGVLSAFEMACWDIIGKELDQPIYNLLGDNFMKGCGLTRIFIQLAPTGTSFVYLMCFLSQKLPLKEPLNM